LGIRYGSRDLLRQMLIFVGAMALAWFFFGNPMYALTFGAIFGLAQGFIKGESKQ